MVVCVCIVDILSIVERTQQVKTENIEAMSDEEARLDSDHAAELAKLRAEQTEQMLSDLVANKEGLASDLQQEGRSNLCRTYIRSHKVLQQNKTSSSATADRPREA